MQEKLKEPAFVVLTAGRLLQAVDYAKRVRSGKPLFGATAAIIGVDLADGILARKADAEGPMRRVADSVVDSAIIATGLVATYQKLSKARPYVGALVAREAFVATGWALDLAKTHRAKKGDDFHKLPSLTVAAFGLAANRGSDRAMKITGMMAIGINAALAYDYYKGWTDPGRTRTLDNGVQEVAGFYDARVAWNRITNTLPQLGAGSPSLQLEQYTGEVIEGTCVELPDFPESA